MKQLIISIGREFGSGGHEIAEKLSKLYELPLYDHNLLRELAAEKNLDHDSLAEFDETKKRRGLFRTVRGMNSCPAYNVAQLQFEFLKKKADAGESFVVVGRCAENEISERQKGKKRHIVCYKHRAYKGYVHENENTYSRIPKAPYNSLRKSVEETYVAKRANDSKYRE